MTRSRKTIETPKGRRVIRLADGNRAKVIYTLVVFLTVDDEADTGPFVGQLEMRGAIEVIQGQDVVNLGGKLFTLETNDGRCIEVRAKNSETASRQWEVRAAGGKGLGPC